MKIIHDIFGTTMEAVVLFLVIMALVGFIESQWPYDAVEYFNEIAAILGGR